MKQKVISFTTVPLTKIDLDKDLKEYWEDGWVVQTVSTTYVDTGDKSAYLYTILMNKED